MSDAAHKAQAVDTILYTKESASSRQRADGDLKVDDPSREHAVAVLTGGVTVTVTPPAPTDQAARPAQEDSGESPDR